MVGSSFGEGLENLFSFLAWCFVAAIVFGIYFVYDVFFKSTTTVKTEEKPSITWELKARGQKLDTVWIYKFKK